MFPNVHTRVCVVLFLTWKNAPMITTTCEGQRPLTRVGPFVCITQNVPRLFVSMG